MAQIQLPVASAVIVPDPVEEPQPSSLSAKRRHGSLSEENVKRPRLIQAPSHSTADGVKQHSPSQDQHSERRRSGHVEERKRGQRLFGALLGTLSQSSSSTAQKRRSDIEKKQQAKLRLQTEEYDEKKKQQLEALIVVRQREQKKYNTESMRIRHSNTLAAARFLQTEAEPKLYYKPWELLPGDDEKIRSQVEEAERVVAHELAQLKAENPGSEEDIVLDANTEASNDADDAVGSTATVGLAIALPETSISAANGDTNPEISSAPEIPPKVDEPPDTSRDQGDDGGEIVLEGEEDTVIY